MRTTCVAIWRGGRPLASGAEGRKGRLVNSTWRPGKAELFWGIPAVGWVHGRLWLQTQLMGITGKGNWPRDPQKKDPLFQRFKRELAEAESEKQRKGGLARKDGGA